MAAERDPDDGRLFRRLHPVRVEPLRFNVIVDLDLSWSMAFVGSLAFSTCAALSAGFLWAGHRVAIVAFGDTPFVLRTWSGTNRSPHDYHGWRFTDIPSALRANSDLFGQVKGPQIIFCLTDGECPPSDERLARDWIREFNQQGGRSVRLDLRLGRDLGEELAGHARSLSDASTVVARLVSLLRQGTALA